MTHQNSEDKVFHEIIAKLLTNYHIHPQHIWKDLYINTFSLMTFKKIIIIFL